MVTPDTWNRFVDDASPLPADPDARVERRPSPAVGARVVTDTELPRLRGYRGDTRVVLSGGAGQVRGPAAYSTQHGIEVVALEVALRDLDDPAGNARRVVTAVDAALDEGVLVADPLVHVAMAGPPSYSWLAAADEVATAGLALALPLDRSLSPPDLAAWIDAAIDRELAFSLSGGTVAAAVAALTTTARLWGDEQDLVAARRWCRSWTTADVDAALDHLQGLG
ncbi:hypothetical protein BH11ACT8_BH11ACT8_21220 [soil metagenome]